MRTDHSFNIVPGGRPEAPSLQSFPRTTAFPTHAIWVTVGLSSLFFLITLWSWTALRPHLSNLGLLGFNNFDTIFHRPDEDEIFATPIQAFEPLAAISSAFTPEVQQWSSDITRWSSEFSLEPNLIAVVMQIESCGHPSVQSSAGALGLFQVMPYHFEAIDDPFNPQTNAQRGLSYLARSYELSNGRIDLTLAGYNGGHGVIDRKVDAWPTETRRYVMWGTTILDDIGRGEITSSHLDEWLAAGGASLCSQAAAVLEQ